MLELIGDRWSLLILRDCIFLGKRRYSEFLESSEGISTNILAQRLRLLADSGILERLADPADRKSALYLPTERGLGLVPVLLEAIRWGSQQIEANGIPDFMVELLAGKPANYLTRKRQDLAAERDRLVSNAN
jgi:DNA-binding HxlR family transcriptional regulator